LQVRQRGLLERYSNGNAGYEDSIHKSYIGGSVPVMRNRNIFFGKAFFRNHDFIPTGSNNNRWLTLCI
jgi:hypothetical protein